MKKRILSIALVFAFALTVGVIVNNGVFAGPQPLMEKAVEHLNKAKTLSDVKEVKKEMIHAKKNLEKAAHNKGGHRVKAIGIINQALKEKEVAAILPLIDNAIKEIQAGIQFADEKQPKKK